MSSLFTNFLHSLCNNPLIAYAVALFLLVWQFKMNQGTSNFTVVIIWGLFAYAIFGTPPLPAIEIIPRVLWTGLFSMALGLVLYTMIWTKTPAPMSALTAKPLIYVTNIFFKPPPYKAGERMGITIEINNGMPGIKLRGHCLTAIGTAVDEQLTPSNRAQAEMELWDHYEKSASKSSSTMLSSAAGLMTLNFDGDVITEQNEKDLRDPNGILYIVGQIDYGSGALDYCGYARMKHGGRVLLCIEHNGPVPKAAF